MNMLNKRIEKSKVKSQKVLISLIKDNNNYENFNSIC